MESRTPGKGTGLTSTSVEEFQWNFRDKELQRNFTDTY